MYKNQRAKLKLLLFLSVLSPCTAMARLDEPSQAKVDSFEKLPDFLKKLEKKHNVSFVYDASEVSKDIDVTDNKNQSLESALKQLESKGISSKIIGNKIILKKIVVQPVQNHKSDAIIIKGRVTAAGKNSEPVPGTSVLEKGTTNGTSTDGDGNFTIKVNEGATLVFSSIGFKTKEVKVTSANINLNVQLEEDVNKLTEVEVVSTGYQQIDRKLFTGSAVKLKAEDVKIAGVTDVSRMLEGRAAGVSVQNVSGTFGSAPKIRVRGVTSITGNNKPLWVVDGVTLEDIVDISMDQLTSGDANTLIGSAVAGINSDDIESFQILKDASATALYGARAMNGVVVITTKKGNKGRAQFSYSGNYAMSTKPNYSSYDLMNSADQMSVYLELDRKGWLGMTRLTNSGNSGVFGKMYDQINAYDATTGTYGLANNYEAKTNFLKRYAMANTDWFDLLFHNSLAQEHSISLSSGTDQSQYYGSLSFYDDNGWTVADNVKRYTANMRANYKLSNNLNLGLITSGSVRQQRAPGTLSRLSNVVEGSYERKFDINPFSYALNTSRTLTAYDENGNLEYFKRNYAPFNILNEMDNNFINLNVMDLKFQSDLGWKLNKYIRYDVIGSIRYVKSGRKHNVTENSNMAAAYRADETSTIRNNNPYLYSDPDDPNGEPYSVLPQGGIYYRFEDEMTSYYLRNSINWDRTFNDKHMTNFLVGQEIKSANREKMNSNGYGYQYNKGGVPYTDYRMLKMLSENNIDYYGLSQNYDRAVSFFATGSYSYKGKYTFGATGRYDGSNQLGKSTSARWMPTWNVSGSWNMTEESWMQKQSIFNQLALRATYGLTASMGNANNSAVLLKNVVTDRPFLTEKESAIIIDALENSDLTWEKQYETNVGLDMTVLSNRLNITMDYYTRNGFDLISPIRTDGVSGETIRLANYADMKSHGFEFAFGYTVVKNKNWDYRASFTFGFNKNEITNLKSQPRIFDLVRQEGGAKEGYPVRGIYSIVGKGLDPNTGIPLFINEEGQVSKDVYLQSKETGYLKYEGSVDPTTTGGLSNNIRYKNFTLNVFFSYQLGNKIRLNPYYRIGMNDLDVTSNEFFDRWMQPGDENYTNIPSIASNMQNDQIEGTYPYNNYNYSDSRIVDGGFVRLKSVSLAYNLPTHWMKRFGMNAVSIQLLAMNPWLIYADKKLNGQDPEFFSAGGVALPVAKQYTLSLKLSL